MPATSSRWAALWLALFLAAGCQPDRAMLGRYLAGGPDDPDSQVVLVLQSSGKGSWTYNDEEVPFQWEVRADQVLLHIKGDGLIAGKAGRDSVIEIDLPGVGRLRFTPAGP